MQYPMVGFRATPELIELINQWRRAQQPRIDRGGEMSFSEAVRSIVVSYLRLQEQREQQNTA